MIENAAVQQLPNRRQHGQHEGGLQCTYLRQCRHALSFLAFSILAVQQCSLVLPCHLDLPTLASVRLLLEWVAELVLDLSRRCLCLYPLVCALPMQRVVCLLPKASQPDIHQQCMKVTQHTRKWAARYRKVTCTEQMPCKPHSLSLHWLSANCSESGKNDNIAEALTSRSPAARVSCSLPKPSAAADPAPNRNCSKLAA